MFVPLNQTEVFIMLPKFSGASQDIFDNQTPRDKVAIAIQFAEHAAGEAECHRFGQLIAYMCNCKMIKGPMKTLVRADEKVGKDYKGDWSKVKDLVRMTILAPTPNDLALVAEKIRVMGVMPPWCILKDEEPKADTDPCGYSGLNFVLQKNRQGSVGAKNQPPVAPPPDVQGISNAQWAKTVRMEIQANVPEMIYGKECEEDFIKMLGAIGQDQFDKMKAKLKIVGGLGHVFYEISKSNDANVGTQETAKALSKRYYEYLRDPKLYSAPKFIRLCHDLAPFVEVNNRFFRKHPVRAISLEHAPAPVKAAGPKVGKLPMPIGFK